MLMGDHQLEYTVADFGWVSRSFVTLYIINRDWYLSYSSSCYFRPIQLEWKNAGLARLEQLHTGLELEFTPITVAVLVVIRLARPGQALRLSGRWYDIVKHEIPSMTLPLSAQSWPQ